MLFFQHWVLNFFSSLLGKMNPPKIKRLHHGICLGFMHRNNSSRENNFRSAGQNVRQALNALPDILISYWTFCSIDDQQICVAILVSLAGHFRNIETCRTKCPAMPEPSAGHQQKSARHARHISRGLVLKHNAQFCFFFALRVIPSWSLTEY